ncbi:MAG TPA: hypothetical protein VK849_06125 [Longimicrobiales bacterium]|nr:hypothetical protein [Longimicrobiales bacterium]
MSRGLTAAGALAIVALGALAVTRVVDHRRTIGEIRDLRDQVYQARLAADSCRFSLSVEEGRFHRFDRRLDTLRAEVRGLEALDPRGVPEARYDEYMERFEAYNDSVASWQEMAGSLRASESACRSIVEAHNALSDSLRRRVEEELREGEKETQRSISASSPSSSARGEGGQPGMWRCTGSTEETPPATA